ncbi:MAG: radical SAM protein, partial [Hyphomicrobiales bacterium]
MTTIDFPRPAQRPLDPGKFRDPDITARGEPRASVALRALETLWINTGTLCNIECVNCYIESSPSNDRLAYITRGELRPFLDEIRRDGLGTREIGFTGGEPFMNRELCAMAGDALERDLNVLILTNAMQPMQRPRVQKELLALKQAHGGRLALRVSVDHWSRRLHEAERGANTWDRTLAGLDWLSRNGFSIAIAGRTCWGEPESEARAGYARLIAERGWRIDPHNRMQLLLFPEMNEREDVPEITTACWGILGKTPSQMMCASSRMVVKRKGAKAPSVVPCTLLPYDRAFDMGATLAEAARADAGMFDGGAVKLCHPHCAKFCVLG